MRNLSDTDRRALRIADDLQKAVKQWLSYRGVDESCAVSPFVDQAGQPAVIVKMNARVASAMIDSLNEQHGLNEQHTGSAEQPRSGSTSGYFPRT
jgi:hypothetical protein